MIVIYGIKEQLNPVKSRMSDTIHQCMMEVLGMPEDKRAQRFIPMEKENFYYPEGRSDRYTVVEINMMTGRKRETVKALIHRLFERFESELQIPAIDLELTVKEQPDYCWGFRGITGDEAKLDYKVKR